MLPRVLFSAVLGAMLGCGLIQAAQAQAGPAPDSLPPPVAALMQAAGIGDNEIGLVVVRGNTVLLSHDAEQSMQPASTIKLLATMVSLDQLGPAFRARTQLRTTADLVDGTLMGDLILQGGADADFNEDVLGHLLQTLRNEGIKTIRGDLIVDRRLFQPARPDLGTAPFDESPEAYYNVIPDALMLNSNLLHIDLTSTQKQLRPIMLPALEGVDIVADMALTDTACGKWEDGWKLPEVRRGAGDRLTVVLHGSFPKNCVAATSINVLDRADYADRLFRATWRRLGGVFKGQVREATAPVAATPIDSASTAATLVPEPRLLASHTARALPELLRDMNKASDNTLARLLYLSLGSLETDPALGSRPILFAAPETTAARAERTIRAWMAARHIDDQGLVLENGSGLSRLERARPSQLAAVLQAAQQSPWAPEFMSSLPIAAVDGTMRRRLAGSLAAARARIKTGTLNNVVAIAGYVPDLAGRQTIVVAMINSEHAGHGAGRAVLDALIDWVANTSPATAVDTPPLAPMR